jgi:excisionase family DNA binding protein
MGELVALDYFATDKRNAVLQRAKAMRMAAIEERIAAIGQEISEWNRAQMRGAESLKIAWRVEGIMFDDAPEVMTLRETASRLGIHYRTASKLAARGELPAVRVGGSWRVPKAALIEWIAANQGRPRKPKE